MLLLLLLSERSPFMGRTGAKVENYPFKELSSKGWKKQPGARGGSQGQKALFFRVGNNWSWLQSDHG